MYILGVDLIYVVLRLIGFVDKLSWEFEYKIIFMMLLLRYVYKDDWLCVYYILM